MTFKFAIIKLIAVFIVCQIAVSCQYTQQDYLDSICDKRKIFTVDTLVHSPAFVAKVTSEFFMLKPLSLPSDTFVLRIEYETDSTTRIFQFSHFNSFANYKIYTFPVDTINGQILFDKTINKPGDYMKEYPSSVSAKDFIGQMKKNKILDLPDCDSIQGYPQSYKMSYRVEFSNSCVYGVYVYGDPYLHRVKFKEAQSLTSFIDYLKLHFNF